MIRRFLADKSGNYALLTGISMLPLMGALLIGVDYTEMSRQRQDTLNALDAAGIATARQITAGTTDDEARVYAQNFFSANLTAVAPQNVTLTYTPPSGSTGGGTLRLCAAMKYHTYFLPATMFLMGKPDGSNEFNFSACSDVRLKNTLEVALVLDNSGSMSENGKSSRKKRIDLLKDASKQLVDQMAAQAHQTSQVQKPVQFSLVPFAASVNVGSDFYYDLQKRADWLDLDGISPIQHENFDWTTMPQTTSSNCADSSGKCVQKIGSIWYARGTGWPTDQKDKPLTRFSVYNLMQRVSKADKNTSKANCKGTYLNNVCYTYDKAADWGGCVEARPSPYDVDDTAPTPSNPATLFVPMFAPDEPDNNSRSSNNWRADILDSSNDTKRLVYMPKYFNPGTSVTSFLGMDKGPNKSCATKPITPLTDISVDDGKALKDAIDEMEEGGNTNVPEGMAWGWRTLSSAPPFTGGRPETERGNDKVLIVLTDGANTYSASSLAGVKSTYAAEGYVIPPMGNGYDYGRMFLGTSKVSKTDYSSGNYTKAMNEHFDALCNNAKAKGIIVMTIALDLDAKKTADQAQMAALKACSSDSRSRRDPDDPTKPAKLFWNSTGASLSEDFRQIGNELSNLRIVS